MPKLDTIYNGFPINWAEAPTGRLFGTNGTSYMFEWDGYSASLLHVGISAPPDQPTLAFSGTGTITGTYNAYLRFGDADGNFSNPSPVTANATASSNATATYTGLDTNLQGALTTPDANRITKRQLLRNTSGQFTTYYVDIDTTDLTSTTLTSTNTDTQLTAQTSIPATSLSLFGLPPPHKQAIQNHLGRMFAAVDAVIDNYGCAQVTNGSAHVPIVNGYVNLTGFFAPVSSALTPARYLYVAGASQPYKITGIGGSGMNGQYYTISPAYADATDPFAQYAIRPAATERRLIYYSQANKPEAWPASNSLSLQEDGDEITGLMAFGSFLYVLERRHLYRLTYFTDPAVDGAIFLALNRGCINQRCWVIVETTAYLLDDQGIHAYSGYQGSQPISDTVQDLFRFSDSPFRINWAAQRWFHAVHFGPQEVIRWFVALSGSYLPQHALCYNYRQNRWWIEEWASPIGSSVEGRLGIIAKTPQVYLGSSNARVLAMWQGTLDGPDPIASTVRGTAEANDLAADILVDRNAAFTDAQCTNNPVSIVDGTGKGQQRLIVSTQPTQLRLKTPWVVHPDGTSVYQVGGIQWRVQFGWWRTLLYEEEHERYLTVVFQTCKHPALATMRMFLDFSTTPVPWRGTYSSQDANGVRTDFNSTDVVLDFTKPSGFVQKRFPGHREYFSDGERYASFQLSGVQNQDQMRLYYVTGGGYDQGG